MKLLNEYVDRTEYIRRHERKLFISHVEPHTHVGTQSIARRLKDVLTKAGIDTYVFKAHSTRSVASSAAKLNGCPIDEVVKAGGWSSVTTFAKYCGKTCQTQAAFNKAALDE